MTWLLAQAQGGSVPTVPPEVLGPLGLTVFLVIVVLAGGRFILGFIKDVMADIRRERDAAADRAKTADAITDRMAIAANELTTLTRTELKAINESIVRLERKIDDVARDVQARRTRS